ncbi:MAG: hypothetical protein ABSF29_09085 [Tepidisphaeraceae bacterium]|jgi:hypothetical protein
MGDLWALHLDQLIQLYGARNFVETGTGRGKGLRHAMKFGFEEIYSIEIIGAQVEKLRPEFASDPRVHLICGESISTLRGIIPSLKGSTIFWLDAHFPGADLGLCHYSEAKDLKVALPLQRELELIRDLRPGRGDVILIDDLRLYERADYHDPDVEKAIPGYRVPKDAGFLYKTFEKTHQAHRFLHDQGYLALVPKETAAQK